MSEITCYCTWLGTDGEGWWVAECGGCGWRSAPTPAPDDACDAFTEHRIEAIIRAVKVRPCHVTGTHTPDHHKKDPDNTCTLQESRLLEELLEALGATIADFGREDHEDCIWCSKYEGGWPKVEAGQDQGGADERG